MIKVDTKELAKLLKKVTKLNLYLKSQDQRTVDLDKETVFTNGPFLHQDEGLLPKEESLKIEQDDPELFAFRRSINDRIKSILK